MDAKNFVENHLPGMDSPEKVYEFFRGLGYKTLDTSYKGKEAWGLREKDKDIVEEIYAVADYAKRFQVLLIKLKQPSPSAERSLPLDLEKEIQYPFFVLTSDYRDYTFVLVEKIREDAGVWKRKIVRLNLDRQSTFNTDKWILSEIAIKDGTEDPLKIHGFLKEAFSVQKVTKKFFTQYKEHFDNLCDSLKNSNKGIKDFYDKDKLSVFAQKLLGRMMFLYFLQKMRWLAGDEKFVSNWFSKSNGNFYQSVLEPLFFEILNKRRLGNESQLGKIPFLNGGLFEKDYDGLVYIPNEIMGEIIEFLDAYRFTISEEQPLEVEVAINPELLGKIFESMLPEYERGKKGTFYTPRSIVHYMCRESLKEYLCTSCGIPRFKVLKLVQDEQTKDLTDYEVDILWDSLDKVHILDPAVGSGAFLVGMMQEIMRLKNPLAQRLSKKVTPAELKKAIIKNNLHGVDIEREAVEIAKLRLWLTLVVNEELDKVEPLPNLDYKLCVGNSLVESFNGKSLVEKDKYQRLLIEDESQKAISEFRKLKDKLMEEMDPERKKKLREEIDNIESNLIEKELRKEYEQKMYRANEIGAKYSRARIEVPSSERKKISKLIEDAKQADDLLSEIKKTGTKPYFIPLIHFAEVSSEKGGFDIVISNPPYVRTQKLSDLPYRDDLDLHYSFVDDLYVHFTFRAFELVRPKGVVTYITSDTYLTLAWKERMRELLQNNHIQRIILTPKAFEATVNTAIYIVQKESLSDYNLTFIDAREVGKDSDEDWEDKLLVFEELREIESYDTQFPLRIGNREIEVSHNRQVEIDQFRTPVEIYKKAVKKVFFTPNQKNLRLYERFMPTMYQLYEKWWDKIKSSKDIQKNKPEIEKYISTLKPGDMTLLGLVAEGGQGLATADNGRFLAVLEGTEEAKRIEERLREFERKWRRKEPKIYETYQDLLTKDSRNDALDELRKKCSEKELSFPRGFIYKVIKKDDVFDVATYLETLDPKTKDIMRRVIIFGGIPESESDIKNLWKLPKLHRDLKNLDEDSRGRIEREYNRLIHKGKFVCFVRGGEAENIYWCFPDRYILWGRSAVEWLSSSPKARWQGYEHFFEEGITYVDVGGEVIKARILPASIYDHTAHSFFPDEKEISPKYLLGVLNTSFASYFANEYLNHTMHFEINDIRLLPIVIPSDFQRQEIETLVDSAIQTQKKRYSTDDEEEKSRLWQRLQEIQKQIDSKVDDIYGV